MIDFRSLKGFSIRNRNCSNKRFRKEVHNLPTRFDEIAEPATIAITYGHYTEDDVQATAK
jgi:hypothetical protein